MEMTYLLLGGVLILLIGISCRLFLQNRQLLRKHGPILDVEAAVAQRKAQMEEMLAQTNAAISKKEVELSEEIARAKAELANIETSRELRTAEEQATIGELKEQYSKGKELYDKLKKEVSLLEETLEDLSFGLYVPHFDFQASDEYKRALEERRDTRKRMIRDGVATVCPVDWQIGGSRKEGEKISKQYAKLLLRAFNAEVDSALANVSWNNITKMEARVQKAFSAINELGSSMRISIVASYLEVCLQELRLTYEWQEKLHSEQEEQRQIREQMREEERALRELERAQREAEEEELRFARALEKARLEVGGASGAKLEALNKKMRDLEQQLAEARRQKERAISQAQLTRIGYVYIISNIGSFGENVFKIGMTRRLDPMDRVRELGDASVPFSFDVHAMVFSEDAPKLEYELHREFSAKRVNLINHRKEFYSVSIDELEAFAKSRQLKLELTKLAEARDYRESKARREAKIVVPVIAPDEFPNELPIATSA